MQLVRFMLEGSDGPQGQVPMWTSAHEPEARLPEPEALRCEPEASLCEPGAQRGVRAPLTVRFSDGLLTVDEGAAAHATQKQRSRGETSPRAVDRNCRTGRWSGISWETVQSRYRELKAEFVGDAAPSVAVGTTRPGSRPPRPASSARCRTPVTQPRGCIEFSSSSGSDDDSDGADDGGLAANREERRRLKVDSERLLLASRGNPHVQPSRAPSSPLSAHPSVRPEALHHQQPESSADLWPPPVERLQTAPPPTEPKLEASAEETNPPAVAAAIAAASHTRRGHEHAGRSAPSTDAVVVVDAYDGSDGESDESGESGESDGERPAASLHRAYITAEGRDATASKVQAPVAAAVAQVWRRPMGEAAARPVAMETGAPLSVARKAAVAATPSAAPSAAPAAPLARMSLSQALALVDDVDGCVGSTPTRTAAAVMTANGHSNASARSRSGRAAALVPAAAAEDDASVPRGRCGVRAALAAAQSHACLPAHRRSEPPAGEPHGWRGAAPLPRTATSTSAGRATLAASVSSAACGAAYGTPSAAPERAVDRAALPRPPSLAAAAMGGGGAGGAGDAPAAPTRLGGLSRTISAPVLPSTAGLGSTRRLRQTLAQVKHQLEGAAPSPPSNGVTPAGSALVLPPRGGGRLRAEPVRKLPPLATCASELEREPAEAGDVWALDATSTTSGVRDASTNADLPKPRSLAAVARAGGRGSPSYSQRAPRQ